MALGSLFAIVVFSTTAIPNHLANGQGVNQKKYKYDIAFSFVAQDEPIVEALNSKIRERFTTFLYSKRQTELAGTDGVTIFSEVFGQASRLVVVFYRDSWGKTVWTRLEETAIKGRFLNDGADFLLLIPIEDNQSLPPWFPVQRIWLDYKRWGIDGAAGIIEQRAQEVGGTPREETAIDKARRIQHDSRLAEERKSFLNSVAGVNAAQQELEKLFSILEMSAAEIATEAQYNINTSRSNDGHQIEAMAGGIALLVSWVQRFSNTLAESELKITYWRGRPHRGRVDRPDRITEIIYEFDRDVSGVFVWSAKRSKKRQNSEQLIDDLLKKLMEYSKKQ